MSTAQSIKQTHRILVVDDDPDHLALVRRWLERAGYIVNTADSGDQALTALASMRPDLVLTDLVMDGMDGLKLLSEVHRLDPVLPVVILSGQARIPDAMKAAHLGVSEFLTKPITAERLIDTANALIRPGAGGEVEDGFSTNIVYRSNAMVQVLERARMVARGDSTVLISGDTGTGKELVARAIHDAGLRKDKAFISINCSALPEQLLESELFGHEKGAFTGALQRHEGLFKAADGGTLFLDEVGDMPLVVQAKLLRVLQDFQVRPVGSTRSIPINVRIISATHRNLDSQVEREEFRHDLYYRLNVVPLNMPPLAERREDIPLLVERFLDELSDRSVRGRLRFSPEALSYLNAAAWPGNIRQLRNVVEQCTVLCNSDVIPLELARTALHDRPGGILPLDEARLGFERRYLLSLLRATAGNMTVAARTAGRNRTEFYKLLNRHELDPKDFRKSGGDSE